ncbi:MAG TPA: hypothetical protein VFP53_01290 [Sphingomicrobium sp.]|nr:hypothetical protein [Sphingomicrobium sp.]
MDPEVAQVFNFILTVFPYITIIVVAGVAGSLLNNWLKIRNGYPLSNSWGLPMHPKTDPEAAERIKLLSSENGQLRAEIGSLKDRLETIERIVTDEPNRLARDIDNLRLDKGGRA